MRGGWNTILAALFAVGALTLAAGCTTTTETDQTLPPYASISDAGRDPASMAKPPPDDSDSVMSSIGDAIVYPFHLIGEAFESNNKITNPYSN
ncbi:MAG: hypothetical protein ABSD30_17975 [Candidatus Binatus sp.]